LKEITSAQRGGLLSTAGATSLQWQLPDSDAAPSGWIEQRMPLNIIEALSVPSGAVNEDCAGNEAALAWVIDGATDVIEEPLVGTASDAAWFALALDAALCRHAHNPPADLARLPALLAPELADEFDRDARRKPKQRYEHPSAAALIVREGDRGLDYVSVGDCTLLLETPSGLVRIGTEAGDAGDTCIADAIRRFQERNAMPTAESARSYIWPKIRAGRAQMNEANGYGVWSITPPPALYVRTGTVQLASGGTALLATDGLFRLVDVFARYSEQAMLQLALSSGLGVLIEELRRLEAADHDNIRYPRAKTYDDATGLLLRLT
jgi:hypothetical protein